MARRKPHRGPERVIGRALARGLAAFAVLVAGFVIYAGFIEPYHVSLEKVDLWFPTLPRGLDGLRILQVSDLESHGRGTRERQVAALGSEARADLVVVTGDLVAKTLRGPVRNEVSREVARLIGDLPSKYGAWMVEGHGERIAASGRQILLDAMAKHGVHYLEDEVAPMHIGGATLALAGVRVHSVPRDAGYATGPSGEISQDGVSSPGAYLNLVSEDFLPESGYDIEGEIRFDQEAAGIGVTFGNQMLRGRDSFYRLRRIESGGRMQLSPHGTVFASGRSSSRVRPSPGPWYRFHVRVGEEAGGTRVRARSWPADMLEPEGWQIDCVDTLPDRPMGGTVGVWSSGPGRKEFKDILVTAAGGRVLLRGGRLVSGARARWREPKVPDYMLHVAEQVPAGSFVIAITHSPDLFPLTAALEWPLLLAGHTQGGQVCLPFIGALSTDTVLGRRYASGLFQRGPSRLYITRGIGTSRVPIRFLAPPELTLITLHKGSAPEEAPS